MIEPNEEIPQTTDFSPSASEKLGGVSSTIGETVQEAGPPHPLPGPQRFQAGRRFGQYLIIEKIAAGGMGVVYKARQLGLERIVALKVIRAGVHAGTSELARFQLEARAVAQLQHPNIVQVYEIGEADGQSFLSMEYVSGGGLERKLAKTPLAPLAAAQLAETLARAIHVAHQALIVHRDLKPSNVLLTEEGIPKIADFGLAKQLDQDAGQTHSGAILGTPNYMAPEQAAGQGTNVGPAADIYALGAILYEMLVGRPPFRAASLYEILELVRNEEPVPPSRLQPGLPRDLETICLKCLHKEPGGRYDTALSLAEDLRRFLGHEPIQARPASKAERLRKWARRRPSLAALILVSFLALTSLLAGGIWTTIQISDGAEREKQRADEAEKQTKIAETQTTIAETQTKLATKAQHEAEIKSTLAQERLVKFRHAVYGARLSEANALGQLVPAHALDLLEDTEACPFDLREFTWRLLHHQNRRRLFGSESIPLAVIKLIELSPDGNTLATYNEVDAVHIWDVPTNSRKMFLAQRQNLARLQFSADGKKLALLTAKAHVEVWDLTTKKQEWTFQHDALGPRPPNRIRPACPMAFSPDGKLLALGGMSKLGKPQTRLWDLTIGKLHGNLDGHGAAITALAFAPDASGLLTGSLDKTAMYWDLTSKKEPSVLRGHLDALSDVAVSGNGVYLATASQDQSVRLWSRATFQPVRVLRPGLGRIDAMTFGHDRTSIAVVGHINRQVRILDLFTGRELLNLRSSTSLEEGLTFLPDDRLVVRSASQLEILDAAPRRVRTLPNAPGTMGVLAFSADGRFLAMGLRDGRVSVIDTSSGKEIHKLAGHPEGLANLAAFPKSNWLATTPKQDSTPVVHIWNLETGALLFSLPIPARYVAISPDESTLAGGDFNGSHVTFWDLPSRSERRKLDLGPSGHTLAGLAFSPHGTLLATATFQGPLHLWDARTGAERQRLNGHSLSVAALTFSPDGGWLASSALDQTIRLWDVSAGREKATLLGHQHLVSGLAWTPDSKTLVSYSEDESLKFWDVLHGRELATIRTKAGLRGLGVSPKGTALALGGPGLAELWDVPAAAVHRINLKRGVLDIEAMALTGSGSTLALSGVLRQEYQRTGIGFLDLWNLTTGQRNARLLAEFPVLDTVVSSPDGRLLAAGGEGPFVWLIDPVAEKIVEQLKLPLEKVASVDFSADGKLLACGGGTSLVIYDLAGRRVKDTFKLPAEVIKLTFTADGAAVAIHDRSAALRLWDVATGKEQPWTSAADLPVLLDVQGGSSFALSAKGDLLAGIRPGAIFFWDLRTRTKLPLRLTTTDPLGFSTLAFTPQGDILATGTHAGALECWDVKDGTRLAGVKTELALIGRLLFAHDGKRVIASQWGGSAGRNSVFIWSLPADVGKQ